MFLQQFKKALKNNERMRLGCKKKLAPTPKLNRYKKKGILSLIFGMSKGKNLNKLYLKL